jgi:alpha,alpha-trehalase
MTRSTLAAASRRFVLVAQLLLVAVAGAAREAPLAPPSQLYAELFVDVQTQRLFPDSKTFVDAVAKAEPDEILKRYRVARSAAAFSLQQFVAGNFEIPGAVAENFRTQPRDELRAHIRRLWPVLTRQPRAATGTSSLLPLTTRYVVPGGRFREMYYWDSYFTMLGLQVDGRHDLVADMVTNFAGLIDRYGHIPNGNRSYYLSRSQPPFFAAMVRLQATREAGALVTRLPQLQREYAFWMDGADTVAAGAAHRRVVRLADGSLLNRYWDDLDIPRDEAYVEDVETARHSGRLPAEVYRELRAAAESGWDFSSRWLADGKTLGSIHTTDFLPVDLNSLLFQLERTIADACEAARRVDCRKDMEARASRRQRAMLTWMWNEKLGAFVDYDWRARKRSLQPTAATAFPLFVDLVGIGQAPRIAKAIEGALLQPHGLAPTSIDSGQQWDLPNGWAPLQWVAVDGLRRHGQEKLAAEIARRWIAENARVYCRTGKLVEKYNVRDAGEGAGGEYPVQDGFGWSNAVLVKLLSLYPPTAGAFEFTGAGCSTLQGNSALERQSR